MDEPAGVSVQQCPTIGRALLESRVAMGWVDLDDFRTSASPATSGKGATRTATKDTAAHRNATYYCDNRASSGQNQPLALAWSAARPHCKKWQTADITPILRLAFGKFGERRKAESEMRAHVREVHPSTNQDRGACVVGQWESHTIWGRAEYRARVVVSSFCSIYSNRTEVFLCKFVR